MAQYAQHPNSPIRVALDEVAPFEAYAPRMLQEFLCELGVTSSKEDVWKLLQQLCDELEQKYVSYGYIHFHTPKQASTVIHSTLPDFWKRNAESIPDWTYKDYVRMHLWAKLTSFAQGSAFMDQYKASMTLTPEFERAVQEADERLGWRSGFTTPLRGARREEIGGIAFAGGLDELAFREFVREHGWTMTVGGMHAHVIYMQHFRAEEAQRYELTPRQLEFLRLSAAGKEAKEIAYMWDVSVQAVTKVRRALCDRFGTTSKMGLMAKAVRLDILTDEDFEVDSDASTTWASK